MVNDTSYMDSNKVELTLKQYLQLLEGYKEHIQKYDRIIDYLFNKCLELDTTLPEDERGIRFEHYNINDEFMLKLIKEACPERFKQTEKDMLGKE